MVGMARLELALHKESEPKSDVAANFTTSPYLFIYLYYSTKNRSVSSLCYNIQNIFDHLYMLIAYQWFFST